MNKKLGILISIPHGGMEIPPELQKYATLSYNDILEDSDAFTQDIYNMKGKVAAQITNNIARAFVDVNREKNELPPENIDGVIKTHTINMKQIYNEHFILNKEIYKLLIKKYYEAYHNSIRINLLNTTIRVALDCHSMAKFSPKISSDSGKKRPLFCLSNNYGLSAPNEMLITLQNSICTVFQISKNEVTMNDPFSGGFITRNYGNNPVPWIQIEMNRKLYLNSTWFNTENLKKRINELNNKFSKCVELFFNQYF